MSKYHTLKQRDIMYEDIPLDNLFIRINDEDIELQQHRDVVVISKKKLVELLGILKNECKQDE